MIKLSEKRTELVNLKTTIGALESIDKLIKVYSTERPAPAYCQFDYIDGPGKVDVQFDRKIIVDALSKQREKLVKYFADLGVEV